MSNAVLVAILGTSGVSAIIGAIIAGMFARRKLGAEATEIITRAASGVVEDISATLERKSVEMATMRSEHSAQLVQMREEHDTQLARMRDDHAKELDAVRVVLQLHVAWDAVAISELGRLGIALPPAPPLLPDPPA